MYDKAHDNVRYILDDLENCLNPVEHEVIRNHHIKTCLWEKIVRPPVHISFPWDQTGDDLYPISEAVKNPAKMLANELRHGQASPTDWLRIKDDRPLQVRPDFGIGLIASVFGARPHVVDNNPPWVPTLSEENIEENIEKLLDSFDINTSHELGWIPCVVETLEYYHSILAIYPAVSSSVAVILPDLQGPFDTAAMLWGSSIFCALHENPQLINRLLNTISDTMIHIYGHLHRHTGTELLPDGFSHQHGSIIRGNLMLRCDSNLMMSPRMYKKQVFVHDINVLKGVGYGSYHSCGCWEHNVPTVMEAKEIGSLDFGGQSSMNDINALFKMACHYKKHLNLVDVTEDELIDGRVLERFPTGATLVCEVKDIKTAVELMTAYKEIRL